jgi:hypothetical protein
VVQILCVSEHLPNQYFLELLNHLLLELLLLYYPTFRESEHHHHLLHLLFVQNHLVDDLVDY